MGLVAVGSSLGGTIIPIAAHNLIPAVGLVGAFTCRCVYFIILNLFRRFRWTMRIIGFILLFVLTMANLVRADIYILDGDTDILSADA
jgi:MFS transporter, MCT family, solute carrier family 16 (monocarboxylic acid transporters), member 10